MISSTSSSSNAALMAGVLVAAALLALPGPGWANEAPPRAPRALADLPAETPEGGRAARIALLPAENLTGRDLQGDELIARFAAVLREAGLDVVSGARVDEFLARHRIRLTGGLDRAAAAAVREDLDVNGVLVTTVVQRDEGDVPRLALLVRLMSTEDEPTIYWMDGGSRSGDDHPGILQLGMIRRLDGLERRELERLAKRLVAYLEGDAPRSRPCSGGRRYRPRIGYRNLSPPRDQVSSIAVLPFMNRTGRESAGEVVALELTRQLAVSGGFRILEPAVVRSELLDHRIVMQDGVSADTARLVVGLLQVDYVLAGTVVRYDEARGAGATPAIEFTVTMLEARTGLVAWQSSSSARGSDGVMLFDLGTIRSTADLTCRLAREVANGIVGKGGAESRDHRLTAPPAPEDANAALPQHFP